MTTMTIQCPTCGLHLVHGEKILSRVQGRRGATRCTRCRDRIHFDATGDTLLISFPDLLDESLSERSRHAASTIESETVDPPVVVSERRFSEVVVRTASEMPPPVAELQQAPPPPDLYAHPDGEPVFLLLPSKRVG